MNETDKTDWTGATVALTCGSIILLFSLGIRHTFGLFLQPITLDQGWGRETFALSIAIQNLVWGFSQPIAGMIADRVGAKAIVAIGALCYGLGLWTMSHVTEELLFILSSGVLIGLGLSGTTFPVIFGAISRLVSPEKRSLAMGLTMSVGSFGQFAMLPISLGLITGLEWQSALILLSILAILMFPLAFGIRPASPHTSFAAKDVSVKKAVQDVFGTRDFGFSPLGFRIALSLILAVLNCLFSERTLAVRRTQA